MKVFGILALSCVLVPLTPHETRPSDGGFVVQQSVVQPAGVGIVLHRAVVGAHRRLEQPACQRVFSEFSDASGQTLQNNLDALGHTGAAYLGQILFADGSGRRSCKQGAFAFTTPGSRVVYVCGHAFRNLAERNPVMAQAIVIHEALHTLGLGENPPRSADITARVKARCGR
jgi:hypothetical protein